MTRWLFDLPANTSADDLPPGWRFGTHIAEPGAEGRYLVHDSGRAFTARLRPDMTLVDLEYPDEATDDELDVTELHAGLEDLLATDD